MDNIGLIGATNQSEPNAKVTFRSKNDLNAYKFATFSAGKTKCAYCASSSKCEGCTLTMYLDNLGISIGRLVVVFNKK